jgi:hypothetical protein
MSENINRFIQSVMDADKYNPDVQTAHAYIPANKNQLLLR